MHLMTHSSPPMTVSTDTSIQQCRISNAYHGGFIISMSYQSHSNRRLFICQGINNKKKKKHLVRYNDC